MRSQGSEHLFFRHFTEQGRLDGLCILLVTHLLPDRPQFIQALDQIGRIGAILPKPKSVHGPTLTWAQQHYPVLPSIASGPTPRRGDRAHSPAGGAP